MPSAHYALLDHDLAQIGHGFELKAFLGVQIPWHDVDVYGACARAPALQPVVFGQFPGRAGVFEIPGPGLHGAVGGEAGEILDGVDELVAVFGRREEAVACETDDCTCEGEVVEEEDCVDV